MNLKRNIILVGTMGSGKSHVGRNLADALQWQFVDTDRVLEKRYGVPIAVIYRKLGEKAFRRAEQDVLRRVAKYHEAVISVGGNFPLETRTIRFIRKYGYVVGVHAADYRIVSRVSRRIGKRPTMDYKDTPAYVAAMAERWRPIYKRCDMLVDTTNGRTDDHIEAIAERILKDGVEFKSRKQSGGTAHEYLGCIDKRR